MSRRQRFKAIGRFMPLSRWPACAAPLLLATTAPVAAAGSATANTSAAVSTAQSESAPAHVKAASQATHPERARTAADRSRARTLAQMFERGRADGNLRVLYYANHNAFFLDSIQGDHDRNTAAVGGKLGFTTAELAGFSLRISAFAQRNIARSSASNDLHETGRNRDLGTDISTLGEAYLQWQGQGLRVRAGNQAIKDAPFTATYDYRIIPQLYQGVSARYGDHAHYLTAMRIYRYKSRIADSFDRTTNYNADAFEAPPPNTTGKTDGFWALGGADTLQAGAAKLSGRAWFFNYKDYANMGYVDAQIAAAEGAFKPFLGLQFIRETDDGRALLGEVDNQTYGAQFGLTHGSLTATLNYDYVPHDNDTFLNGALVTPYAHNEASGPLFAQPLLTSTQDLGSGSAYSAEIKGSPIEATFLGARYSYMDLVPRAGADSIGQSEYLVYAIYHLSGALDGLSVKDFFAYQTQAVEPDDYWENRLALEYAF